MDGGSDGVHVPPDVRRVILRTFTTKHHLQMRADAVQFVYGTLQAHDLLQDAAATAEAVEALATALVEQHVSGAQLSGFDGLVVTREILQKMYDQLLVESAEDDAPSASARVTQGDAPGVERYLHVLDAFSMPRTVFSASRKVFERYVAGLTQNRARPVAALCTERPERAFGRAVRAAAEHCNAQRAFSPPARRWPWRARAPVVYEADHDQEPAWPARAVVPLVWAPVDDAGWRVRARGQRRECRAGPEPGGTCVCLTQIAGEGIFTEGAYILVEGEYTPDERLRAFAIGHPPSENRESARYVARLTQRAFWPHRL